MVKMTLRHACLDPRFRGNDISFQGEGEMIKGRVFRNF